MGSTLSKGSKKLPDIPFSNLIDKILTVCFKNSYSFAGWKRPEDNEINMIISLAKHSNWKNYDQPGFIVNPYDNRTPASAAWIYPDLILKYDGIRTLLLTKGKDSETFIKDLENEIENHSKCEYYHGNNENGMENTSQGLFLNYANKVLNGIKSGDFEKVVPARLKTVDLMEHHTPGAIFLKLTETYKSAFKSLISHPEHGTWLGATPELFGHWENENEFNTFSLAGTQRIGSGSEAVWNDKELEEQGMVTQFIMDRALKLGIPLLKMTGPNTVKAGQLNHLKTDLKFKLHEGQKVMDILYELHPTPAVCGLPRNAAYNFIKENEPFNRGLYAGFIGPVNFNNSSDIYVNLRCMKLNSNKAILFAGAGMTRLSNPENEWFETEYKCDTINRVLLNLE